LEAVDELVVIDTYAVDEQMQIGLAKYTRGERHLAIALAPFQQAKPSARAMPRHSA
jgi:hypothetical protein